MTCRKVLISRSALKDPQMIIKLGRTPYEHVLRTYRCITSGLKVISKTQFMGFPIPSHETSVFKPSRHVVVVDITWKNGDTYHSKKNCTQHYTAFNEFVLRTRNLCAPRYNPPDTRSVILFYVWETPLYRVINHT